MIGEVNIGDRVILRKTGNLGIATVIGMIHSERYCRMNMSGNREKWDELYPDWRQNPIVTLEFDKPQRAISYEEYCEAYSGRDDFDSLQEDERQYFYDRIPVTYFVQTPIDDVEPI